MAVLATSPMVSNPANRKVCTLFDLCPFKRAISISLIAANKHCGFTGFFEKMVGVGELPGSIALRSVEFSAGSNAELTDVALRLTSGG